MSDVAPTISRVEHDQLGARLQQLRQAIDERQSWLDEIEQDLDRVRLARLSSPSVDPGVGLMIAARHDPLF